MVGSTKKAAYAPSVTLRVGSCTSVGRSREILGEPLMDKTQLGRAGELALALYAMVSSDGELQLFTPVADDDHVDATAGRRGGVPAIAIQVKTASEVDRYGLVEAKADYRVGYVREHRAFLYVVLLMNSITVEVAWLL